MAKRLKGLYRDCEPIDQPPDTYRYANNALLTEQVGAIMSDYGLNDLDLPTEIGEDFVILGHTSINNNRVVLFTVNSDGSGSKISILNSDGSILVVIKNPALNLNFSPTSQIEATYRINQDNEAIVYWTDGVNPPRFVNVDNIKNVTSGFRYNIFKYLERVPLIDFVNVDDSGGSLSTGSYYFAVRYVDKNENKTNFSSISNPVYINDNDSSFGVFNDGAEPNTPTSKAINIEIKNIDIFYDKIEIAVIKKEGGTFAPVRILPQIYIQTTDLQETLGVSSFNYKYTGLESYVEGSLDEIIIDNVAYEKAKTLEQVDNVLYMGNLTKAEDIGYQKYANNIKLEATTTPIEGFLYDSTKRYRNPDVSFNLKGYQRDEVYAFYISFILNDGSESKAYHIPGRPPINNETTSVIESDINTYFGSDSYRRSQLISDTSKNFHFINNHHPNWNTGYWENENEVYPDTDDWDIWDVNAQGIGEIIEGSSLRESNVRHHRMPDNKKEPIMQDYNSVSVLQIRLHDIKIPKDILSKVKSFKIYYAKPNNSNKRILDQSFSWNLFSASDLQITGDTSSHYISALPYGTETLYKLDNDHSDEELKAFSAIPFYSMRSKDSISYLNYLQKVYVPIGKVIYTNNTTDNKSFFSFVGPDTSSNYITNNPEYYYYSDPSFGITNFGYSNSSLIPITSKAYLPHAQDVVELKSKGFLKNAIMRNSESQIFMEYSDSHANAINPMEWNPVTYNQTGFIANLMSYKIELYNSFDLQELVWTGYSQLNLQYFDPSSEDYNTPFGNNTYAVAVDTVLKQPSLNGTLNIDIEYNNSINTISVSLVTTDTKEEVAAKIINAINTNSSIPIKAYSSEPEPLSGTSSIPGYENGNSPGGSIGEIDPGGGGGQPEETVLPLPAPSFSPNTGTYYYSDASHPFEVFIIKNHSTTDKIRYIVTQTLSDPVTNTSTAYIVDNPIDILSNFNPSTGPVYLKAKVFSDNTDNWLDSDEVYAVYDLVPASQSSNIYYQAKYKGAKVIKVKPRRDVFEDLLKSNLRDTTMYLKGGSINKGVTSKISGGDIFICKHSMRISGVLAKSTNDPINKAIVEYIAESRDNIELRHSGINFNEIYFPGFPSLSYKDVLSIEEDGENTESEFFDNYYGYNIDYSSYQDIKTPIPYEKNQVFSTINFPTRVIRSQENVVGSTEDNFRIFLANNYKDFQYDRGELVKLNKYANNLILHFERAIALTRGREELATGDFRAFVGAGNIFEVEPNELLMSENGTGGIQNINHSLLTEEGYFFVDQEEGSIYSLTGQGLANISDVGMRNEFEKILPWNLKKYANDFNPYTLDKNYFGINWGYDKEHSRLFFVKRDLKPTQTFIDANPTFDNNTFYDNNEPIAYAPGTYFELDNVCLSFVPQLGSWISYHSHYPKYLFSNLTNLYGSLYNSESDPSKSYLYFYNYKELPLLTKIEIKSGYTGHPFEFEFVENRAPNESKMFTTLSLITSSVSSDGVETQDETFNSFRIYNNKQDSGTQTIVPFQSLESQGNARKIEGTWKINKFRNLLVNGSVDPNKDWYQQDRFIGNYVVVKLTYYNSNNNFLYLTDSEVGVRKSLR